MSLSGELRQVAKELGQGSTHGHWRRAVSTAYYAVFHLLLEEATAIFGLDGPLATAVQRSFDHKEMSKVSKQFSHAHNTEILPNVGKLRLPSDLVQFALGFNELQGARIEADYDSASVKISQTWAQNFVEEAEAAFECWARVRADKHAKLYLLLLLASKVVKPRE